jgi:hypothetical protein
MTTSRLSTQVTGASRLLTPHRTGRDYEALRVDMNTLFHHLGIQTAAA